MESRTTKTRGSRAVLCASAIALVSTLAPASASAQEVADASCGPRNFNNDYIQAWKPAQVFTAENTGQLTRATAELGRDTGTGDFVFEVLEVDVDDDPTDTVLASTSASDAGVAMGGAFPDPLTTVSATFSAPASVVAGEQYAFAVSRPTGTTKFWFGLRQFSTCPSEGWGRVSGTWGENNPDLDMVFEVFVTVPELPVITDPCDSIPPETSISSGPSARTKSKTATIAFFGTDEAEPGLCGPGIGSFQCKLDSTSFEPCTSPKAYSKLKKGKHTFEVRAVDVAGNVDSTPATRTWTVKKKKKKK